MTRQLELAGVGANRTRAVNLRVEEYDVYIGRPGHGLDGRFGNPFDVRTHGRDDALTKFREYFLARVESDVAFRREVLALRGKRLGCFCAPRRCHGDVIAEWVEANS